MKNKRLLLLGLMALLVIFGAGCAPKMTYASSTRTIVADCSEQPGTTVHINTGYIVLESGGPLATITLANTKVQADGSFLTQGTFGNLRFFDQKPGAPTRAIAEGRLDCR